MSYDLGTAPPDALPPETFEDAIFQNALAYFRENGAMDSKAEHLTDSIYGALGRAEQEEAFIPLSAAVERSFNRLRINGYRCEQDWTCCQSCGWEEIPWEDADHCVWYHAQDKETAIRTGKLWFVWQGDSALIREAFEAEGLTVEHDGEPGKRIQVEL